MMDCLFTENMPETCRTLAGNLPKTPKKGFLAGFQQVFGRFTESIIDGPHGMWFFFSFFQMLKVRHPRRQTSGFRTVQILTIWQTSGPDVMSGRALIVGDTSCGPLSTTLSAKVTGTKMVVQKDGQLLKWKMAILFQDCKLQLYSY